MGLEVVVCYKNTGPSPGSNQQKIEAPNISELLANASPVYRVARKEFGLISAPAVSHCILWEDSVTTNIHLKNLLPET